MKTMIWVVAVMLLGSMAFAVSWKIAMKVGQEMFLADMLIVSFLLLIVGSAWQGIRAERFLRRFRKGTLGRS